MKIDIKQAKDWIAQLGSVMDSGEEWLEYIESEYPKGMQNKLIENYIARHYAGGIEQFNKDGVPV